MLELRIIPEMWWRHHMVHLFSYGFICMLSTTLQIIEHMIKLMQVGQVLRIHTVGCRVNVGAPLRGRLVRWDPASGFQHHVSNRGKMNHWLKAYTHTVAEAIAWHLLGLDMWARCWKVRAGSKVTGRTDHRNEVYTGTVTNKGCYDTERKHTAACIILLQLFLCLEFLICLFFPSTGSMKPMVLIWEVSH